MKPFGHNTDIQYTLHAAHAQFSGQDENIRLYFGVKLEMQLNRSYISVFVFHSSAGICACI